jgi:hypothetical protein
MVFQVIPRASTEEWRLVKNSEKTAVENLESLIEGMWELRQSLRIREESLRLALASFKNGADLGTAMAEGKVSDERRKLDEALLVLEHRRDEARRAVFALALERGMSINELNRTWGISCQSGSSDAQEAEGES